MEAPLSILSSYTSNLHRARCHTKANQGSPAEGANSRERQAKASGKGPALAARELHEDQATYLLSMQVGELQEEEGGVHAYSLAGGSVFMSPQGYRLDDSLGPPVEFLSALELSILPQTLP